VTEEQRATNATIHSELVALRERLDLIWANHEREHTQHEASHTREHAFTQDAIEKAAALNKENKADANEWRQSMNDREARFSTKADVGAIIERLDKIERAGLVAAERDMARSKGDTDKQNEMERRTARSQWMVGLIVGVVATVGAVAINVVLGP
jgi:hypothetical protein